jgi:hypothetical protein
LRALCRKPEYYLYYSWAPCQIREVTPEQLADRARVTAAEKPVIIKLKAEFTDMNARLVAAHRQYNEKYGEALATNIEQTIASAELVRREYLDGRLTRGEYNKRRRDIAVGGDAEAVRIMKGS